jgi:hypothetical protein
MLALRPLLLDFFERSPPDSMIGQTAVIHFALVPLLYEKTRIPTIPSKDPARRVNFTKTRSTLDWIGQTQGDLTVPTLRQGLSQQTAVREGEDGSVFDEIQNLVEPDERPVRDGRAELPSHG